MSDEERSGVFFSFCFVFILIFSSSSSVVSFCFCFFLGFALKWFAYVKREGKIGGEIEGGINKGEEIEGVRNGRRIRGRKK